MEVMKFDCAVFFIGVIKKKPKGEIRMKKIFLILGMCIFASFFLSGQAQQEFRTNFDWYLVDEPLWNPCFNDGEGEWVLWNGPLHQVGHVVIDATGRVHLRWQSQPHHLIGIGQTSGDTYIGVGITKENWKFGGVNFPLEIETLIDNTYFISKRNGDTVKFKGRVHLTFNANGEMTAYVDEFEIICK
jgi:hypothetical protein